MRHHWRAALAVLALVASTAPASGAPPYQVIVHPGVRGERISRESLAALYTGRTSSWGDKSEAKPVDQSAQSGVRRAFTSTVLGLSMGELQMYWQRKVVADRVFPPPTRSSDEDVIRYVAETPGAVGYVAPDTSLPDGVKPIAVVD